MAKNKRKKSKKIEELKLINEGLSEYIEQLQEKYSKLLENTQSEPAFLFLLGALIGFFLGAIIGEVL